MSFETTRVLIETHLATLPSLGFPIVVEGGHDAPAKAPWARFYVMQGTTAPAVIGPGHLRGAGMVVLQVFIPEQGGTKPATTAADALATLLDRRQLVDGGTVVTFDTVGIIDAGRREGYTQKNCVCNFTRDTYA